MELICTEQYNDIRFTLKEGDTTELVPFLTEEEKVQLLADYPSKFGKKPEAAKEKVSELVVENKESNLKVTKKAK